MFADERATRNERVGYNPDVEENHEVVDQESESERPAWRVARRVGNQDRCCCHGVHGKNKGTIEPRPVTSGS